MTGKGKIVAVLRRARARFAERQELGRPLPEMSRRQVACLNCGTPYAGNYCPRCGQSAKVGASGSQRIASTFMEAYPQLAGTFFHTLLDLLYRPGQLVRDYFNGRRAPYCGPFKTAVVLLSIVVLLSQMTGIDFQDLDGADSPAATEQPVAQPAMADASPAPVPHAATRKDASYRLEDANGRMRREVRHVATRYHLESVLDFARKKLGDSHTLILFIIMPLIAMGMKLASRRQLFNGRRLCYGEHLVAVFYLFSIDLLFSVPLGLVASAMPNAAVCDKIALAIYFFYLSWIYKVLYGWSWSRMLWRMLPLVLWGFGVVLAVLVGGYSIFEILVFWFWG